MGNARKTKLLLAIFLFCVSGIIFHGYKQFNDEIEKFKIKVNDAYEVKKILDKEIFWLLQAKNFKSDDERRKNIAKLQKLSMESFFCQSQVVRERKIIASGPFNLFKLQVFATSSERSKIESQNLAQGLSELSITSCPEIFAHKVKELIGAYKNQKLDVATAILKDLRSIYASHSEASVLLPDEKIQKDEKIYFGDKEACVKFNSKLWQFERLNEKQVLMIRDIPRSPLILCHMNPMIFPWREGKEALIRHFQNVSNDGVCDEQNVNGNFVLSINQSIGGMPSRCSFMFVLGKNRCFNVTFAGPVEFYEKYKTEAFEVFKSFEILKSESESFKEVQLKAKKSVLKNAEELPGNSVKSVMRIFSQTLVYQFPKTWPILPAYKAENRQHYLVEYVPLGQDINSWKDLLTIQGFKGLMEKGINAEMFVKNMILNHSRQAPGKVVYDEIFTGKINGSKARIFMLGIREMANKTGEIGIYIVIEGKKDICSIHRSWKIAPFKANQLPIKLEEVKKWVEILKSTSYV